MSDSGISHIDIYRKKNSEVNNICINSYVVKPGLLLGVNSSKLYELRDAISKLLKKNFPLNTFDYDVVLNLVEVVNPDVNSRILADFICQQLEKRVPFRRAMKSAILKAQKSGIKGIKVQVSGRLNGAEIARTEWVREGQVPLHTLRANIEYCSEKALVIFADRNLSIFF